MTYQQILEEFGEDAAEAFLEWEHRPMREVTERLTGDPVEDYLILKGLK